MSLLIVSVLLAAAPNRANAVDVSGASETVTSHLDAVARSDYDAAFARFDAAYRKVFAARVPEMRVYYDTLKELLKAAPRIDAPVGVPPSGARVKVSFGGYSRYYYLLKEGGEWKIDIFSDAEYESVADARREVFLNTVGDWNDDGSREMKAIQGLYRIQQGLESYRDSHNGRLPKSLLGGDSRDALIFSGALKEYPRNPFFKRSMKVTNFADRARGDLSYVPFDYAQDGFPRNYFLVLYGPVPSDEIFVDANIVYELNSLFDADDGSILKALTTAFEKAYGLKLRPRPALAKLLPSYSSVSAKAPAVATPSTGQKPPADAAPPSGKPGPVRKSSEESSSARQKDPAAAGKWRIRAWGLP
jgi:hypothetical protein